MAKIKNFYPREIDRNYHILVENWKLCPDCEGTGTIYTDIEALDCGRCGGFGAVETL